MAQHVRQLQYSQRWRDKNYERWCDIRRNNQHINVYGISLAERAAIFEKQGCACAICGTKEPTTRRKWHLDHNHTTKKVRGILCHACNLLLGHAKDSIERLKQATEYLEKHDA